MRGSDGNSLAVIFTVKPPGQGNPEIAGLALVAVSPSAAGKGAVLTDQADRFRSTVGPMLKLLQSGAGLSGPEAAPHRLRPLRRCAPGAAHLCQLAPRRNIRRAGSARRATAPDAISGWLGQHRLARWLDHHRAPMPAKSPPQGPAPAALHFDWQIPALDPNDPRSRGLMRPGTAASFVDIPYGTDAANTFKLALTQFLQKRGKSPPTIEIVDSTQVGPKEALVSARMGAVDGHGPTIGFGRYRHWSAKQSGELSHHAIHHQFPAGTRATIAGHRRCHAPQLQGQPGCARWRKSKPTRKRASR